MSRPSRVAFSAAALVAMLAATPAFADEALPPLPKPDPPPVPRVDPPPAKPAPPKPAPPRPKPPPKKGRGAWRSFNAGSDLVGSVPMAAILDGGWSITTQINTSLIDRTWTTPRPYGTLGHYTRRLTYGLSWSLMLGVESMIAIASHGDSLDWIGGATYRTDWMLPVDLPACRHIGADGGCGIGVGNMAFITVAPRHSKWWFEAGGGWFEQRVLYDAVRTLGESTWMLTPLSVMRELSTNQDWPIALQWYIGPGIYGGMHSGNMHPSVRGQDVYPNFRASELYVFDGGVGPGLRTELHINVLRHLTFEGNLVFAPLLIGGASRDISRAVEPLNYPRSGVPIWRKLDFGIGFQDYKALPFKPVLMFFGAELSERHLDKLGYRGGMIRFDVPIRVPGD